MPQFASVDEYVGAQPEIAQKAIKDVLQTVHEAVAGTEERIKYQIPTVTLRGRDLLYVATWKRFLSVYPVGNVPDDLEREISPYRAAKATLRFPLAKPIPFDTIARVARHRAGEEA